MTPAEQKQPAAVFLSAGKHAFEINVHVAANPYTLEPFRTLWDKGYRKAKSQHEESFVRSGRIAYASGLTLQDNPNLVPYQRLLWERGFKGAQIAADRQAAIARGEIVPQPVRKPYKPYVKNGQQPVRKAVTVREQKPRQVHIPTKGHRTGTIGDYVAASRKETR